MTPNLTIHCCVNASDENFPQRDRVKPLVKTHTNRKDSNESHPIETMSRVVTEVLCYDVLMLLMRWMQVAVELDGVTYMYMRCPFMLGTKTTASIVYP